MVRASRSQKIQAIVDKEREETTHTIVQIAAMAFSKNHPNWKAFVEAVTLSMSERHLIN